MELRFAWAHFTEFIIFERECLFPLELKFSSMLRNAMHKIILYNICVFVIFRFMESMENFHRIPRKHIKAAQSLLYSLLRNAMAQSFMIYVVGRSTHMPYANNAIWFLKCWNRVMVTIPAECRAHRISISSCEKWKNGLKIFALKQIESSQIIMGKCTTQRYNLNFLYDIRNIWQQFTPKWRM